MVGGNLYDDTYIDVLDFASYVVRFGLNYGTSNTTCDTPIYHADFSGNGIVFTDDFLYIAVSFLNFHEANCCDASGLRGRGDVLDATLTPNSQSRTQKIGAVRSTLK